jgi:hypothetical protein
MIDPERVTTTRQALPTTHQGVDALVDEARRRQDALVERVRTLAADRKALDASWQRLRHRHDDESASEPAPGLLASLAQRLRRRRRERTKDPVDGAHGETELRGRVEAAFHETKKASWLADRFAALRHELDEELAALVALVSQVNDELAALTTTTIAARLAAGDAATTEAARDEAERQRNMCERRERLLHSLAARIEVLVVSARGVLTIVDALHDDVDAFARSAASLVEGWSARARALGLAHDARAVVFDLEASLDRLGGTLDEAAIFATAVCERLSSSTSESALRQSLDTLVAGASARKAAARALDEARAVESDVVVGVSSSS